MTIVTCPSIITPEYCHGGGGGGDLWELNRVGWTIMMKLNMLIDIQARKLKTGPPQSPS